MNHSMKQQQGGTAIGFVLGLLTGLACALAVALYVTKTPVPLMNKVQQHTPEQDAAEAERNRTWDPNAALAGKSTRPAAVVPATPASDTAVVPRPAAPVLPTVADNGHVAPPTAASAPASGARSARDAAAILNGGQPAGAEGSEQKAPVAAAAGADTFVYYVQVGAYSRPEDAEQQRAKLALAGFHAAVTDREQNGRTVHRVRLGPFEKKDDADAQVERAKTIDADASLVRVERSKQ